MNLFRKFKILNPFSWLGSRQPGITNGAFIPDVQAVGLEVSILPDGELAEPPKIPTAEESAAKTKPAWSTYGRPIFTRLSEVVDYAARRPGPRRKRRKFPLYKRFRHELEFATARGIFAPRALIVIYSVWVPLLALFCVLLAFLGVQWNQAVAAFMGLGGFPAFLVFWALQQQLSVKVESWHEWGVSIFRRPLSQWYDRDDALVPIDGKDRYVVWSGNDPDPYRLEACPALGSSPLFGPGNDAGEMYQNVRPWEMQYLVDRSYNNRRSAASYIYEYGGLGLVNVVMWLVVFFLYAEANKPPLP